MLTPTITRKILKSDLIFPVGSHNIHANSKTPAYHNNAKVIFFGTHTIKYKAGIKLTPISLFTAMTDTRTVSGRISLLSTSKSTSPFVCSCVYMYKICVNTSARARNTYVYILSCTFNVHACTYTCVHVWREWKSTESTSTTANWDTQRTRKFDTPARGDRWCQNLRSEVHGTSPARTCVRLLSWWCAFSSRRRTGPLCCLPCEMRPCSVSHTPIQIK